MAEEGEGGIKESEVALRKLLRGVRFGFSSTCLIAALRNKTALLFVNQASALAGKGHFSTQPPKCYAHN